MSTIQVPQWVWGKLESRGRPDRELVETLNVRMKDLEQRLEQIRTRTVDYEEGISWTPTDASGAGLSFAAATGRYSRIGDLVIATLSVQYPATADGTNAKIGGLPYTVVNAENAAWGVAMGYTTQADLVVSGTANTQTLELYNGTTGANLTNALLTGDYVRGTLIYERA